MNDLMGQQPQPMFNCSICGRQTPLHERHVCVGLTDRQVRRVRAWQRLQGIAARRRAMPEPCPDCSEPMYPARPHACRGRVDRAASMAAEWQLGGFKSALRRVGFTVEKD